LYVLCVTAADAQSVVAWKPPVPGVHEVFHAAFVDHAYPGHTHDTWTVLVVDDGDIRYDLDRRRHGSVSSVTTVLPPHVVHDGRAGPSGRFRKKVLYLDDRYLGDDLIGHAVDAPTIVDRHLRAALDVLHRQLAAGDDALAIETRLVFVAERLRGRLVGRPAERPGHSDDVAARARDVLDASAPAPITLADLGARLDADPAHVVRSFSRRFGIPPHAYLIGRRIDAARRQLLQGRPAGAVAADLGFYDQAHLARHFKRHVGTTPGRFARSR
jgi:AraC-like DNA-binding protein